MTIVLASDHNGVKLKADVKNFLKSRGVDCVDIGPYTDEQKVDYVDFAGTVGQIVSSGDANRGVLICGTGVGMSIAANRFPGSRASLVHSKDVAEKTREHNDSNILCLGSWVCSTEENLEIVEAWLAKEFGEGRHVPRVEKLNNHPKQKVVFTNGCFDIVHPGHIALLNFAKSLGGKLVVAINSDASVQALKGPARPINAQADRKEMLENLGIVDQVLIFDEESPLAIRTAVNPDVVVKGGEWTADEVRQRDSVPEHAEVRIFPLLPGYSTTNIVNRIRGPQ